MVCTYNPFLIFHVEVREWQICCHEQNRKKGDTIFKNGINVRHIKEQNFFPQLSGNKKTQSRNTRCNASCDDIFVTNAVLQRKTHSSLESQCYSYSFYPYVCCQNISISMLLLLFSPDTTNLWTKIVYSRWNIICDSNRDWDNIMHIHNMTKFVTQLKNSNNFLNLYIILLLLYIYLMLSIICIYVYMYSCSALRTARTLYFIPWRVTV